MRIYSITIFMALLQSFSIYSQTKKEFNKGRVYKIKGEVKNKVTGDTIRLATLEFMNKDHRFIKATRSDFDGMYVTSICSNALLNDTLLIKATNVFYQQEVFRFKIDSDSIIDIKMLMDVSKAMSKKKFGIYNRNLQTANCMLIEDNEIEKLKYQINNIYIHYCSGMKKKYQDLIKDNEILSEWILIKK